jgi:putative restriction endonuclease
LKAYENNLITDNRIYITPELVALFKTIWNSLVVTNHECRISYPFYYLKSEKFWRLIPKTGFENINQMGSIMKSFSNLNSAVEFAVIEEELFLLMKDKIYNGLLQQFLLEEYFPETKNNFYRNSEDQQKLFSDIENKILNEPSEEYRQEIRLLMQEQNEEEIFLRGSLFKREIPKIYNNTCCISGMRIDAINSISMVDACHIVPFSISYDDTITNGIALCPNLHRAFDRGLISIDNNYTVLVSSRFQENLTDYTIRKFESKQIQLPKKESYFPSEEKLRWHRENVFR